MKARESGTANTLRGNTSPEDGDARDSRQATALSSAEGPSAFISQKSTSIVKKQRRRGFKPPMGSCPLLQFSSIFLEIWEREAAPANYLPDVTAVIYGRDMSESAAKHIDS